MRKGGRTEAERKEGVLEDLRDALAPSWHDTRRAGRVALHTEILRDVAREISVAPERPDLPSSGEEAHERFRAHIEALRAEAPRAGLGAATGRFVDHIATLFERYGAHLFVCFDDPRVPPSTNMLEGFFGGAKRILRRACGAASTANSVAQNLGGDYLAAFAHAASGNGSATQIDHALDDAALARFREVRLRIAASEAPATANRSRTRHFDRHVNDLRRRLGIARGQERS